MLVNVLTCGVFTKRSHLHAYHILSPPTGSTDGHFALASMLQSGQGGKVDVPGAIRHSVIAANAGHARSKYFLAHALYDPESWLYTWGRQQTWKTQEKDREQHSYGRPHNLVEGTYGTKGYGLRGTPEEKAQQIKEQKEFEEFHRKAKIESDAKTIEHERLANIREDDAYDGWVYDEGTSFILHLPSGNVEVPMPLGQSDGCLASLFLMQSISHMSGRTNDLMDAALVAYMEGEWYESLELYNEAAELGVPAAQENSAILTEFMAPIECSGVGDMLGTNNHNQSHLDPLSWNWEPQPDTEAVEAKARWVPLRDLGRDLSAAGDGSMDLEVEISTYKTLVEQHKCTGYFDRTVYRRFTQLANSGDAAAKNELAQKSLRKPDRTEEDIKYAASMLVYASEQGDVSRMSRPAVQCLAPLATGKRNRELVMRIPLTPPQVSLHT
jgi:TPR repeat protein